MLLPATVVRCVVLALRRKVKFLLRPGDEIRVLIGCLVIAFFGSAALGQDKQAYVAYSLRTAQRLIKDAESDWRKDGTELVFLGGINEVRGFVYDEANDDLIIFGSNRRGRAPLTLDDLVVALRGRFIYREWPLVSIDPAPNESEVQFVRFEGGIRDTAFGRSLFDADFLLKELSFGLVKPGINDIRIPWDRASKIDNAQAHANLRTRVRARFWVYPSISYIAIRDNVCVVSGLQVGVFTEVLGAEVDGRKIENLAAFEDPLDKDFADDVSRHFDRLRQQHAPFNRLRGLQELIALTKAIEDLGLPRCMEWWLKSFKVRSANTPSQIPVLRRTLSDVNWRLEFSGGVHLTALSLRARAGDIEALRDIVLKTRPSLKSLSWGFEITEGVLAVHGKPLDRNRNASLQAHAEFLIEHGRYSEALTILQSLDSELAGSEVDLQMAICHVGRGNPDAAIRILEDALKRNDKDVSLWEALSATYSFKALAAHPRYVVVWNREHLQIGDRGGISLFSARGNYNDVDRFAHEALRCSERALSINPRALHAWSNRGLSLILLRRAKEIDQWLLEVPTYDESSTALEVKAAVLSLSGRAEESLQYYQRALAVAPLSPSAWYGRGKALKELRRYSEAYSSMRRALNLGLVDAGMQLKLMAEEIKSHAFLSTPSVKSIDCATSFWLESPGPEDALRSSGSAERSSVYVVATITFDFSSPNQFANVDASRLLHAELDTGESVPVFTWDDRAKEWQKPGAHIPTLSGESPTLKVTFRIDPTAIEKSTLVYATQQFKISIANSTLSD